MLGSGAVTSRLLEHETAEFRRRASTRRRAREARLRRLGFASYDAFIASPLWRAKRDEYWSDPDTLKDCSVCGSDGPGLALHHRTYERVGDERLSDLTPVCPACHTMVHALDQRGDLDGIEERVNRHL